METALLATAQTAFANRPAGVPAGADIDKAARDFEAMFIGQLLGPMFAGLEPDPLTGGGFGEEMFQGMMIEQYGKQITQAGGIGIADRLKTELLAAQEAAR